MCRAIAFASLILLLFSAPRVSAQGTTFEPLSWEDALSKAGKESKDVFVDAYTDWCGWCKVMDKKTFPDPMVGALMNKRFVAIKLDMEEGIGQRLAMKYRIMAFPSYLVFRPSGKLVAVSVGYQEPKPFLAELERMLDPAQQLDLKGVGPALDIPVPEFYRLAFAKGNARKFPTDSTVNAWLAGQQDLFSEECWSVISRFGTGESVNQWVMENRRRLESLYGKPGVDDKIISICSRKLKNAIRDRDDQALEGILEIVRSTGGTAADRMALNFALQYYLETRQWENLRARLEPIVQNATPEDAAMINEYAWSIYEKCDDAATIRTAVGWMARVIAQAPIYMYIDTYAALLFKDKQYVSAERNARQAIEIGRKSEEDVSSTEKLLEQILRASAGK